MNRCSFGCLECGTTCVVQIEKKWFEALCDRCKSKKNEQIDLTKRVTLLEKKIRDLEIQQEGFHGLKDLLNDLREKIKDIEYELDS